MRMDPEKKEGQGALWPTKTSMERVTEDMQTL